MSIYKYGVTPSSIAAEKRMSKKTYRLVFHGPNSDASCRRAVAQFAKRFGGKTSYRSFWIGRRREWHSDNTVGKAAYTAVVPLCSGRAALLEIRRLRRSLIPGLCYTHHM